jgi:hypothetical protein
MTNFFLHCFFTVEIYAAGLIVFFHKTRNEKKFVGVFATGRIDLYSGPNITPIKKQDYYIYNANR